MSGYGKISNLVNSYIKRIKENKEDANKIIYDLRKECLCLKKRKRRYFEKGGRRIKRK